MKLVLLADAGHVNTQRWCEGLASAGADIDLLSFGTGESSAQRRCHHIGIPQLPFKLHYFASVPAVRRLINRIRPHVVVAYYATGYGTLGALTGYHPLIQVTSGSDVLLAPQNPILRRLLRYNLSRAELVTAWAPHMASAVQHLGVPEERILVLPRGIPVQHFANARCSVPSKDDSIEIVSTRSLRASYNLDRLINAIHILRNSGGNFRLTFAGDGPLREELIQLARRLNLEQHVRFAGFLSNDRLPGLLAQHHLYVSLIDSDGVSASLLEAMSVGLLPIVPDNLANRLWIKTGCNGVLLDDLTPSAIAQAINRAAADLPLRRRAWQQNPDIVKRDADLYRNSEVFMERFRRLASGYHRIPIDELRASLPSRAG